MATRLHGKEDLPPIRKLRTAAPRLPTVLYGQLGSEEIAFELAKAGVDHFIPQGNLDELLATLHHLKEQASFRIELRDFGIDLDQRTNYWVRRFVGFIIKDYNFLKYRTVEEVTNRLGISPITVDHVFKKESRLSPKQLLLCLRNFYAAYLLEGTNWSVKTIAEKCGFTSEQLFSRNFKNMSGVTPVTFRKENHLQISEKAHLFEDKALSGEKVATQNNVIGIF